MQKQVEKYTGKWMFWKDVDKKQVVHLSCGNDVDNFNLSGNQKYEKSRKNRAKPVKIP